MAAPAPKPLEFQALSSLQASPEDGSAKNCLSRLFVSALNEQTDGAWKEVLDFCFKLSEPERERLSSEPGIQHYVHRSLQLAESLSDPSQLIEHLTTLLPEAVEQCRQQGKYTGHSLTLSSNIPRTRRRKKARKRVVSLDSGLATLLTYSPTQIAATFRGPGLQLSDVVSAASAVSHEMTQQFKTTLSPPHRILPPPPHLVSPPHPQHDTKPFLSPVFPHEEGEPCVGKNARRKITFDDSGRRGKDTSPESKLHTANDVIAAFATGSLQAGAESIYLNYNPGSPWNPYNLTVVPKTRANPEHYVISKFGILHVQPGGNSDLQSFADWLREAGLFSLCRQIPFFREFLTRKIFRSWHHNVCYCQFLQLLKEVDRVGLQFFPEFHETIEKIHKLNTELLNLPTLALTPLGSYSANNLEKTSEETEAKTHRLLQRYFKYCKRVVSEAVSNTQQKAKKLEEEKKHQPFVSDSPISVQVAQHADLERRLGVARYRASRLGDFVCLAEQMMAMCLLQKARQSAGQWVGDILQLSSHLSDSSSTITFESDISIIEEQSEGVGKNNALMMVELKIAEQGGVVTQPGIEKIVQLLLFPLNSVIELVSTTSTTVTAILTKSEPSHLTTNDGAKGDRDTVKMTPTGARAYKPLLQVLKGINLGGSGTGHGNIPESSRARSRLDEVQAQACCEIRAREEFSRISSPLVPQNMERKLKQDPELQSLSNRLHEALAGLRKEVSAICQQYMWLEHTQSLISRCKRDKISDMTAENFETVLGELHVALSRVTHLPPLLSTSHSLITISTVQVASQLEPQLQQTMARLQDSLAAQALVMATQLLRDAVQHTQMLSSKRYDLEGFVQYAHSLRESQAFHAKEAANTQRVADIHTTLRKYRIPISDEARETLQRLQEVWEEFEACLVEGGDFVNKQTPIKAQGLQESILVLEEQLERLVGSFSVGDFIDPSASPQSLLLQLESTLEEMSMFRGRLMELSKWEEAITGRHHDLSRMFHCFDVLYARQELWKYRRQFDSCYFDWSRVPFKKLDMAYVEQKVNEWWAVCDKLGKKLPSTDPVLEQWRENVGKIHTNMSTLQLLASRDIQTSHWHTIFAGFNEQYDPRQSYTLHFFLERDPSKFSDLISEVHCLASQQSRLREKFVSMEKMWETRTIGLRQTSVERYSFCLPPSRSSLRQTTITFQDSPDTATKESEKEQLHSVEGGEVLGREMEAAVLELNNILSSPHLGRLKKKVELLRSSLCQISELFHLLLQCQSQWKDLLELFLYTKPLSGKSIGLQQLQSASSHLQEVMASIHGDPRLFSLLSKSRGRKGVRDLQGPELRKKLKTVLQCLETVMLKLHPRLEEAESQWPRLGYLTQREKLRAISCRGDPLPIIPLIGRVFPSIVTLHYIETSFNSDHDTDQGYQVTGVEGKLGEHLTLVHPLPLEKKSSVEWLAGLEQAIKFSLASRLTDCLATLPHPLTGEELSSDTIQDVMEWMEGNVEQNILLALDIHWSHRLLESVSDTPRTREIWSELKRSLENTVQLLLRQKQTQQQDEQKVLNILRSLVAYLRRKSDFVQSLLSATDLNAMWHLHVHYTTDPTEHQKGVVPSVEESRVSSPAISNIDSNERGSQTPPDPQKVSTQPLSSSLTAGHPYRAGKSPLQISPPTPCFVHAGRCSVVYGFEYYSPAPQIVLTPSMESGVAATISAFAQHSFPCVSGEQNMAIIKEAAKVMGRHHYHHTCCHLTTATSILRLLHTALSCGSVLSMGDSHCLPTAVQLKMRHYLHTLQSALATCFIHQSTELRDEEHCTPSSGPPRVVSSRLDWYGTLPFSSCSTNLLSLEHMGKTLSVNPNFGCCVFLDGNKLSKLNDTRLRTVVCVKPDERLTVEVLLLSHGFSSAYNLSKLLVGVSERFRTQLSVGLDFGLPWLQNIITLAAKLLHSNICDFDYKSEAAHELEVVARAVLEVTTPLVPPGKISNLEDLIISHLLGGGMVANWENWENWERELAKAVEEEMNERHFQISPEITNKMLQLHKSLGRYSCTVLLGPSKSGISTCYQTLASACARMGRPSPSITVINPAAHSWEQLFGSWCKDDDGMEQWTNGILSRLLLHIKPSEKASSPHWIVLDGPLSSSLLDTLTILVSDGGLCLPGMERVKIPSNCRLLLKPGPLPTLSPGLVGSCGIIHWSSETVTHDMLVDSWLDKAPTQHDLTGMSISYLANVLQSMVPESLDYLDSVCSKHYSNQYTSHAQQRSRGIAETSTLLTLLSAMLERNCPTREDTATYSGYGSRSSSSLRSSSIAGSLTSSRCGSAISQASSMAELTDQLPPLTPETSDQAPSGMDFSFSPSNLDSVETQTLSILAFAFIWSIGAYVPFSELDSFNEFSQKQINDLPISVCFPEEGSVFEYYLDLQTYKFEHWSKRKSRLVPKSNGYIPTPELSRVAYIAELYLSYGHNVLLLGEKGSGKTSIIQSLLQSNLSLTRLPITVSLTAPQLHSALCNKATEVSRVDKMRWGSRKIGIPGQNCLFFLDDLHMSYHENEQSSQAAPSITQLVSFASRHNCLFTFPDESVCYISNIQYLASSLPGHHYTHFTHLLGSFHPVPLFPLSDQALHTIFSTSVQMWFKKFPNAAIGEPETLARGLSVASVTTFRSVCARLRPTPAHPEWFLSLQHLIDVFKGLMLMPLDAKTANSPHFGLLNRRATPSTGTKSSSRRISEKSGRKSSSVVPATSRRGTARSKQSVHLPPVKKESSLRSKIRSELKGKKQQHDSSEVQATLHRLLRLWCHENTRVFADRMTESSDRAWFVRLLETCVKYCFCGVGFEKAPASTGHGGRPGRRGRGVSMAAQSVGLNMTKLVADGVRADVLQALMPRSQNAPTTGQGENIGELIPLNQVITRGEDITALIVCKLPTVRPTCSTKSEASSDEEGTDSSEDEQDETEEKKDAIADSIPSVYQELGDGQVLGAIEKHIQRYATHCAKEHQDNPSSLVPPPDFVLFQQAMEHATRLCRAVILPGCHALLLGVPGSGRKSLCRLVAYMMRAELFEMEIGCKTGMDTIKKACLSAATASVSPTVLLISSTESSQSQDMWSSSSQIMSEGPGNGFFTNTELIRIQNVLRKDHLKKAVTPQAIARLVHNNLHIVVIWNTDRSTHSPIPSSSNVETRSDVTLEEIFSMLCSRCGVVDHYQPWGQRELSEVAQKWWREKTGSLQDGWITSESQLESLADLATHVHLSSLSVMEQSSRHLSSLLLSPSSYTTFLTLAHSIAVSLTNKHKGREERVLLALEKVAGGEEGRRTLQGEQTTLKSQLREVEAQLDERERNIEACQQRYKSASQEWSEAKKTIISKTETLKSLQSTVTQKMEEMSSLHSSALEALSSVSKNDVLEVMSYREPPASAIPVFNSLCMLFDRPQTWEDGKLLLLSPNFFESLRFFDKDHLPRQKLRELRAMLRSPHWKTDSLEHASKAVSSLAMWVGALLDYHHARDVVKPSQEELSVAEAILTKAELTLVAKQKIMMDTKVEFKQVQRERSGISKQKKALETKIAAMEERLREASVLLSSLSPWQSYWEAKREAIHAKTLASPGHAVLLAASVIYLSRMPAENHSSLWESWLGYCMGRVPMGSVLEASSSEYHSSSHQARVQIEPTFSSKSLLSLEEERARWNHYASFPNAVVMDRCISARKSLEMAFTPPPLVLDPHQLFQSYAHELELHRSNQRSTRTHVGHKQPTCCVEVLRVSASGWAQTLLKLEENREKAVVLILDVVPSATDAEILLSLLRRRSENLKNSWDLTPPLEEIFRLYLVLEERVAETPPILESLGLKLLDFTVVDMELSMKALESHLLKFILRIDHPEYAARHRALLVDNTFYENQIETSKEKVIASVLESSSVLDSPHIKHLAEESLQIEASALESIRDTEKALAKSRSLVNNYRPLSLFSTLAFTEAQQLCGRLHYHTPSLAFYQDLIAAQLARHKRGRPPEDPAACQEHVLRVQKSLLLELHDKLKWGMFRHHHLLLPLLVHLAQHISTGEINPQEYRALEEYPRFQNEAGKKPAWLSEEAWAGVQQMEKLIPVFQGLLSSLVSQSESWKEYCREEISLSSPTPLYPNSSLSPLHSLLLLMALKPEKFSEVVEQFVSLTAGHQYISQWTVEDSIASVLSMNTLPVPVVCLTHCEGDEENVEKILRESARERGVRFHHVELADDGDKEEVISELVRWSSEHSWWVLITYTHLLEDPKTTWKLLTEVVDSSQNSAQSQLQLWLTVPWPLSDRLTDPSWPCLLLMADNNSSTNYSLEMLAHVRLTVHRHFGKK